MPLDFIKKEINRCIKDISLGAKYGNKYLHLQNRKEKLELIKTLLQYDVHYKGTVVHVRETMIKINTGNMTLNIPKALADKKLQKNDIIYLVGHIDELTLDYHWEKII